MVAAVWAPIERIIGRGVELVEINQTGPLEKAGIHEGDVLIRADGKKLDTIRSLQELVDTIEFNGNTTIHISRIDWFVDLKVSKNSLLKGKRALDKLGIKKWKTSRYWRSSGSYSHYATFAEVLQLITSLTFGLLVAGILHRRELSGKNELKDSNNNSPPCPFLLRLLLLFCVMAMALALLLTVTRASQGALIISLFSIVVIVGRSKIFLVFTSIAIPVIILGAILMLHHRGIGFFDLKDGSTTYRLTIYQEGLRLWYKTPHNFILGVGMDSIKRYKKEWNLFDNGKLPAGHFHSTPIQLIAERGIPALLFWLWILGAYLLKLLDRLRTKRFTNWIEKGVLLGCFGGSLGFFASGLVHYNLGDGEVIMVFYMLMAFAISVIRNQSN